MISRREREVARDEEVLKLKAGYEAELKEIAAGIGPRLAALRAWAKANRAAFKARKSIEFDAGTIGFRTGTPRLKTRKGVTWEAVLESLRAPGLGEFIRVKEEVDKEALIGARRVLGDDGFKRLGLALAQEETFFVEPALSTPACALRA